MRRNNKNNQDNHSILSSSLFQLCNEQSSGTVFIMTNRNTSARFVLHKGTVSAFCFEKKQGMHASVCVINAFAFLIFFLHFFSLLFPSLSIESRF